jgi:peptidoglycan/LPS O-acetylase OafA/YrhL
VDTDPTARPEIGDAEPAITRIPALDGIRAIGIILVLFFHGGFSWAGGGFFGVDVFFVLSGFLITGLLVSEFRRHSGIGLRRFWGHRVRRLVPALLAVLVAVALYGWLLASPDTLDQLRGDALATLFYVNNWHQISGGQGYFAALNTPRPLLHTWSLSIEEQFYLVWPLVVLGILRWTRSLRVLLTVTVAGAVASAVLMALLYNGGAGASRDYFGTDTRAQALLIGAALAIVLARPISRTPGAADHSPSMALIRAFQLGRVARIALVVAGGLGLVVIGWMSLTVNSTSAWPYFGGFGLLALATAALIASVALVPAGPWSRALSLRPIRYVGAISYGLYLWHWPIFVVLDNARTGLVGWPLFGLRVGVSFAVAVCSFHFLEMPVRRGALRGWRAWAVTPLAVGGTVALVVASTAGAVPSLGAADVSSALTPAIVAHAADPGTSPDTPTVAAGTGGPIRALLVGDSEAAFLGFGLGPDSGSYDIDYAGDGVLGCGLLQGKTTLHNTLDLGTVGTRAQIEVPCDTQDTRWEADLHAFHPDVVLLAEGEYEVRNRWLDGRWTHIGEPAFDSAELSAMQHAVTVLRSTGATVVLLTAVYYHQPEQADGQPWPEDNPQRVDDFNAMLRKVAAADGPGVVVENLNAHLDPGGQYAQYLDGQDVRYADGIHVSAAGAKLVAPWLLGQVEALGKSARAVSPAAASTSSSTTTTVTGS